jgi:putative sigma-54 modulation protein
MATVIGRNFEVTPDIRALLEKKIGKIQEKLFADVIEVRCVLQVEKYRNICEVIMVGRDHDAKTVQQSDESMQDAINMAVDHLKRQAQKSHKKLRDHHRKDGKQAKSRVTEWAVQVLEPAQMRESGDNNRPRIIKTNNLPIRPMSIEEAALRLEDSKNEFIVFRDVDSDKISVIYKRQDENLGLIAPEV